MGRVMSSRNHPLLPHEDAPLGHCRWCGSEILGKKGTILLGRRLHDGDCRWNFRAAGYGLVRWAVFHRDGGVCAICGKGNPWDTGWEADHIYPLWLVDRSSPETWRYWALGNLQTLCAEHHTEKSRREARVRAYVRWQIRKSPGRPVQLPLPEFPPDKMCF